MEFPPGPGTALRIRLEYDEALEAEAFRRLEALQMDACREAFARLIGRVDLARASSPDDGRAVVLLLHDLLQRVARVLEAPAPRPGAPSAGPGVEERWALYARFAPIRDPHDAVRAFFAALRGLLAPWENGRPAAHPLVERAREHIRRNFHRKISLSSVARHLNVSSNYLSRRFRQETGMTLTTYVHRVRLRQARRMLAEGGRSISEVAYLAGYQNYRDFYRNFVKYENASPSEVLRALQAHA